VSVIAPILGLETPKERDGTHHVASNVMRFFLLPKMITPLRRLIFCLAHRTPNCEARTHNTQNPQPSNPNDQYLSRGHRVNHHGKPEKPVPTRILITKAPLHHNRDNTRGQKT